MIHNKYNIFRSNTKVLINTSFNTFGTERNIKLVRLYLLLFNFTGQRPFIKKTTFFHIKKKILKKITLQLNVKKKIINNLTLYFSLFYIYFYNIYFQNRLKYNFNDSIITYYIDNFQTYAKNFKLDQSTQFKVNILNSNIHHLNLLKILNTNEIFANKKQKTL